MTELVRFDDLEHWLSDEAVRWHRFPPEHARSFAALIEHYGRRLDRPRQENKLREALIKYLDHTASHCGDDRPVHEDDLIASAQQMLLLIEVARGGTWPINGPIIHGWAAIFERRRRPVAHDRHAVDNIVCTETTLQVEPGLGKRSFASEDLALTDNKLALYLGVSILRSTKTKAAVGTAADVLRALGVSDSSGPSAAVTVSKTGTIVSELLAAQSSFHEVPELTPHGVRAAFEQAAGRLTPDTIVRLRRALPRR